MNFVDLEYNEESISDIINEYYLNVFCNKDSAQIKNIAITLKYLYFLSDILQSADYSRDIESSLCRDVIILSYSIIDGIVGNTAFKIQQCCNKCKHRCRYYSTKLLKGRDINNFQESKEVDDFMRKIKVLNLDDECEHFYQQYRKARNNIHLTRNDRIISDNYKFTRDNCELSIHFLQQFIEVLHSNLIEFIRLNKCDMRK